MSIYIIDEIMGGGKTSAMINHINKSTEEEKFLFITPYLKEVERIKKSCPGKKFKEPNALGGKLKNIKILLRKGHNIVSTHALFSMFDSEALSYVKELGYTLIIDEVVNAIDLKCLSKYDADYVNTKLISTDESGKIVWKESDYTGLFSDIKQMIESSDIFAYTDTTWVGLLPVELFTSFKDVYIMTYMFEYQLQRGYFDLQKIEYSSKYITGNSIDTYEITDTPVEKKYIDFKSLVNILDNEKLNKIGDSETALSKNWYMKNINGSKGKELKNDVQNYFHHYTGTKANQNLWTTYCDSDDEQFECRNKLKGNGYTKAFLPCNARGTNDYKDRTALAYLVNRFANPNIIQLFNKTGIEFDEDGYALSEMIQWIWRSAIREGKPIQLYIPSKRMRNLLIQWLDEVSIPKENMEQGDENLIDEAVAVIS